MRISDWSSTCALPVSAADAGKPDPAGVEGPAAHARRGRCAPPPLLAHRFLLERGAPPLPARPRGALGTPASLFETAGRRPCRPARHTGEGQEFLGPPARPRPPAPLVPPPLYRPP